MYVPSLTLPEPVPASVTVNVRGVPGPPLAGVASAPTQVSATKQASEPASFHRARLSSVATNLSSCWFASVAA
jgi:hypothetical protein